MQPLIQKKPQLKTYPSKKNFSLGYTDCRNVINISDKGQYRIITIGNNKLPIPLKVIDTIEEINNYLTWAKANIEENKDNEFWYKADQKSWR